MDSKALQKLIAIWFEEDIRDGDHTSLSCIPQTQIGTQQLIIKGTGILAGVEVAKQNRKIQRRQSAGAHGRPVFRHDSPHA